MESTGLVNVSAFRRAISVSESIPELRDMRDKAEAIRKYYAAAGAGLDAQNQGAEMKIRAERRIGELLAGMPKHKGGRPTENHLHDDSGFSLADIGITHTQSSRWQAMAAVDEPLLQSLINDANENRKELTSKAVYSLGKAAKQTPAVVHPEPIEGVCDTLEPMVVAGQKFGTIYADPPWRYDNRATRSAVESIYAGTMTVDELCELPVKELAADDAHLHLWVTAAFLPFGFRIMEAWGFEYRTYFVWCKPQMGIGNYWRKSSELMLTGIRGNAKRFAVHNKKDWMVFDRTKHSAKPNEIRELVTEVSPGPYLELFGRKQIPGWTVFGNQVESHVEAVVA